MITKKASFFLLSTKDFVAYYITCTANSDAIKSIFLKAD